MNRLSALAVSIALAVPGAAFAQPVDPGFSVPQQSVGVDSGFSKGPGSHPVASVLLFPIYLGARIQASLQPEKNSCWNGDSSKVAGCNYADRADEVVDNRPTPYGL